MKALVTGMNGTVAPALARVLASEGHEVVPWDRAIHPIDNVAAVQDFIRDTRPDWFFHLALGSPDWAEWIAAACAQEGIDFLFTSSVSVYADSQRGPYTVDVEPQPQDDYGRYKLDCERRVREAHPGARVVRIGWQIGTEPGGNHMVSYLDRTAREAGQIDASTVWYPSCSFLPDTGRGLTHVMQSLPAGLYLLEGNPGLNFYEIAQGLKAMLGAPWSIIPTTSHVQHNLMLDERVPVNPITNWFPTESSGLG